MRRDGRYTHERGMHHTRFTEGDEGWRADAACRGRDTDLWFVPGIPAEALAYCNRCPVTAECLAMALRAEAGAVARYGVFGGLLPRQRAQTARMEAKP